MPRVRPTLRQVRAFGKASTRAGWTRVKGAVVPNTQAAVFSVISWVICHSLLNQTNPIFAPIATFLCLGFSRNRQPRKVVELGIGATVGVAAGEILGPLIGFGWWQLLLILLVMPLIGRMLDNSDLLTFQTAINAMVVMSMSLYPFQDPSGGWGRAFDAIVGSFVALVASVILPTSLTSRPRRFAKESLLAIADAVESIAAALRSGDEGETGAAFAQLQVAREQLTQGSAALSSAKDTAALNPSLRGSRAELSELDRQLQLIARLHISVAMLTRQSRGMVEETGAQPQVAAIVERIALALRHLSSSIAHWMKPTLARSEAEAIARELVPHEMGDSNNWRGTTLAALLRPCVVDLLQMTGLSLAQARAQLADTTIVDQNPWSADSGLQAEAGSDIWGTTSFPAVPDD